jgi:hypothetical protein
MLRTSPNQIKGRGPQSSSAWYPRQMRMRKKNGMNIEKKDREREWLKNEIDAAEIKRILQKNVRSLDT